MNRISLRSGIPFISFFSDSSITLTSYSNKSISVKGNFECLDDAVSVFHQMVTMKHYSAAVSLFREMWKLGIPINGVILNIVVNSYCLMHRVDCGFSVLPIYLKNGIPFNTITFNTLLRGIFAENKIKDAVELFKKLVRENICEPDEVTYGTVMNGLCKRGHTQKTLSLLQLMEQGNT
ncbi:putative pentatricopeptide repeat-containing protein At1g12700, mitochondrial [Solanum dulcamara]|nr:putative pentatricopeptide repeat-containing protein At1g12700, mitochondrial [Solanum dulcamara]